MENQTNNTTIPRQPTPTKPRQIAPDPDLNVPERGSTGPVTIGEVMEPLKRIIEHPDRNRLIAEFFNKYW